MSSSVEMIVIKTDIAVTEKITGTHNFSVWKRTHILSLSKVKKTSEHFVYVYVHTNQVLWCVYRGFVY